MLTLKNIQKSYFQGENEQKVLKGIDLEVLDGEFIAIMGPSGSGKSTLMNIIGCLDKPSRGEYFIEEEKVSNFSDDELADLRNQKIGFVFQNFNLLPKLSILDNVCLPLIYSGVSKNERKKRAYKLLELVGLKDHVNYFPNELSGGQKQRVAIARALVSKPSFILADEPTGALDTKNSIQIMSLFRELNNQGTTIVLITHEPEVADLCDKTIVLRDGLLLEQAVIGGGE
ncbi:ABC transporter ATP-binding protein [Vagococcus teuberi]|uniref:Macrolide ABC transporter ATP-binding protein n=1 Tax=Vagococcus teuberi TaxID=519472 RepID=A0A1J0A3Z0_9ENTE|nr:ABC transporter ATP-binding protein [Vagococcus teuberi]APB30639.1 macrolide ABC transporter ATP-binding protein [Vagococcus teuberi]